MRRNRVLVMLAALALGALLPMTSLASATPVTYSQQQVTIYNGDCATGNVQMVGLGLGQFAGAFNSEGYSITQMESYGNFPNQVTGITIYYTDPSESEAFALIVFTGTLRCDGSTAGKINGPVWSACVFDVDSGATYRGNGAGRGNSMEFGFDDASQYGYNLAQLSGKLRPDAQACDFVDAMGMID